MTTNRFPPSLLLGGLLVLLSAAPRGQQVGPPSPTPEAERQVIVDGQLVPASALRTAPTTVIEDIVLHRGEPLSYVRGHADIVPLAATVTGSDGQSRVIDLGDVDLEAEVLLVVDGEPVTREEFRRRAIMYTGTAEIEKAITRAINANAIASQVAEGREPADLVVTEEDVDRKIAEVMEVVRFQARGGAPTVLPNAAEGDVVTWSLDGTVVARRQGGGPLEILPEGEGRVRIVRGSDGQDHVVDVSEAERQSIEAFYQTLEAGIGAAAWRESHRAEAEFERVFLPIPAEPTGEAPIDMTVPGAADGLVRPPWMPQITWDALASGQMGPQLRAMVCNAAATGEVIHPIFEQQLTTLIRQAIVDAMGVTYFFDRLDDPLPEGVFMRVGSEDVRTDTLWTEVGRTLTDVDAEFVLRELLTLRGMRRTLERAGHWLDDAGAAAAFAAENDKYEGTLLPLRSIIIFRGYYSLDRYREHLRYMESYANMRRATLTDEELDQHYRNGGRLLFEKASARVDAAYYSLGAGTAFTEESFARAEAEMRAVHDGGLFRVVTAAGQVHDFRSAGERDAFLAGLPDDERGAASTEHLTGFEAVLAAFPPPPKPEAVAAQAAGEYRFQRNTLRQFLTESELSALLNGYLLADDVIYNGLPGEVFPIRSQRCRRHYFGNEINAGVWMVRVLDFVREKPLPPLAGLELEQARSDFIQLNFLYWSQECLRNLLGKVSEVAVS